MSYRVSSSITPPANPTECATRDLGFAAYLFTTRKLEYLGLTAVGDIAYWQFADPQHESAHLLVGYRTGAVAPCRNFLETVHYLRAEAQKAIAAAPAVEQFVANYVQADEAGRRLLCHEVGKTCGVREMERVRSLGEAKVAELKAVTPDLNTWGSGVQK